MPKRTKPLDQPIPGGIDPDSAARWNAEEPPAQRDPHPTRRPRPGSPPEPKADKP